MMNKKGKIDLGLIIGVLLLFGIVVCIMHISGVINLKPLFGGEGRVIPLNYEEKLETMCESIDSEGTYNKENQEDYQNKIDEFYNSIFSDNKDFKDDKTTKQLLNQLWEIDKNLNYCSENKCYYPSKEGDRITYDYDCAKKELNQYNIEDKFSESIADRILINTCESINNNGFYESEDGESKCGNYNCSTVFRGKNYTKKCKE